MKQSFGGFRRSSRLPIAISAVLCAVVSSHPVMAQGLGVVDPSQSLNWQPPAISHVQRMRQFRDVDHGSQSTPPIIPRFQLDADPSGAVGTFQPNGATITSNNAFFQNLGTNERTCFTCHQPANGWSISAASVQVRVSRDREHGFHCIVSKYFAGS